MLQASWVMTMARGLLALGFLLSAGAAWAEAGRVMYVSGQATLIRGGNLPIAKGMAVEAGDAIVTGADGRVQLLMADGDRIALRPDSRFSIDEFSGPARVRPDQPVAGARPSSWRSFYTLAKGGFRTLTQSLGQRDASSYQVRTPVATIGIRGTDYTLLYCPKTCEVYQTAGAGVRVEGMQASVFRDSAGSRLLFAALGLGWVQEFLRAQEQGSGGSNSGQGQLLGGVSSGEIEVKDPGGNVNTVKDNEFFQADNGGFQKLPEPPAGLNDQSENSEGEGEYQEQVGETDDAGESEGESEEGEGEGTEEFSARTDPIEGDSSGGDTSNDGGDGTVGDLTMEFGTADTGSTDASDPPVQEITTDTGEDLTGGEPPAPANPRGLAVGTGPILVKKPDLTVVLDDTAGAKGGYVPGDAVQFDGGGRLTAFAGEVDDQAPQIVKFTLSGGNGVDNVNYGEDLSFGTDLRWGRWAGNADGTIIAHFEDGSTSPVDLSQRSLHWIYGPEGAPVLPTTGTASYALVGNTDPTDNHGHAGFLGTANFSANFSDQTVFSSVDLSMDNGDGFDQWSASGNGSFGSDGGFEGSYSDMSINASDCTPACNGEFAGFFTPGGSSNAAPPGAGMTYSLDDGNGTSVSGAAAFGNPDYNPNPPQ